MKIKVAAKIYGLSVAFIIHVAILTMLSVTVVNLAIVGPPLVQPQVTQIEIGEQIVLPQEATMSGVPEPEDWMPPAGDESEFPEDADLKLPSDIIPNEIILDPLEPPPEDIARNPMEGQPGIPTPPRRLDEGILRPFRDAPRGLDSRGIPELFGLPLEGSTVFLLDLSGSMGNDYMDSTRLAILKAELISIIKILTDKDKFDIVVYTGILPSWVGYTKALWGNMSVANNANKEEAEAWIETLEADGSTPTYEALKYVCGYYPETVENMVLVTDGAPDDGTAGMIVAEIKGWMKRFIDCQLVCICIGDSGLDFVKSIVDAVDGVYTVVE